MTLQEICMSKNHIFLLMLLPCADQLCALTMTTQKEKESQLTHSSFFSPSPFVLISKIKGVSFGKMGPDQEMK